MNKLPHVLLFAILAVVTGGNSYRSIVTFIDVNRGKLNDAFGLKWRRAPAHTAIQYILQWRDAVTVEAVFRHHAAWLQQACGKLGKGSIALDGKMLRGSFDNFADRAAAQVLTAFATETSLVLAHAIGIAPSQGHLIHQATLSQLAREADKTTVQHVAQFERQRRHATLVAITLDFTTSLTDQAIDLFDRLVGGIFRKAEGRQARAFQSDARAINEKVRLYARVGAALITAQTYKQDAFGAIATKIPWDRFCKTVAEAEAMARPEEFNAFEKLGEHYSAIRRWSPRFLSTFAFESVPASAPLLRAIEILREMNRTDQATLPKSVPTGRPTALGGLRHAGRDC